MTEKQKTVNISTEELLPKVKELHTSGHRLVQIGCTRLNNIELNYSFDKAFSFVNLRLTLPLEGAEVPSISTVYWNAFLYENEVHDLFGIDVQDIVVDYKGNLYRTKIKYPFRLNECKDNTDPKSEDEGGSDAQ